MSWFILCLIAAIVVLLLCGLFSLTLMWIYLGVKCFVLHILLSHIAACLQKL